MVDAEAIVHQNPGLREALPAINDIASRDNNLYQDGKGSYERAEKSAAAARRLESIVKDSDVPAMKRRTT